MVAFYIHAKKRKKQQNKRAKNGNVIGQWLDFDFNLHVQKILNVIPHYDAQNGAFIYCIASDKFQY